jgi:hypothetical protein
VFDILQNTKHSISNIEHQRGIGKRDMKKSSTELVAWISLTVTIISLLWNVFFGYGELIGRMDAMQEDITEIKADVIRLNYKMDHLRVTVLEQSKP